MVVHFLRVRTIKPLHIGRDAFAKVGLEAVDAHRHQTFEFVGVPLTGFRVGEVIYRQPRLPLIPLPQRTVRALQQIALLSQLLEHRRALADIRIDPHADLQPFRLEALDHPFRVRESQRIPFEIAPLEGLHPETVEMEDVQRQLALGHAVDKAVHRRFVIVGGERGGQPQTKRPCRRQRRATGELRIAVEHRFRRRAIDHEVLKVFTFHAKLDFRDLLRAHLEGDALRVIDQHAVAAVGQVERNVFIGLLGAGAAVFVPGFYRLAVAHQVGKALAETVDGFADTEVEALKQIIALGLTILHVAVVFQLTTGDTHAVAQKIQRPEFAFSNARAKATAFQLGEFGRILYGDIDVVLHVQRVVRTVIQRALEVLHTHPDHPFQRGEKAQGE